MSSLCARFVISCLALVWLGAPARAEKTSDPNTEGSLTILEEVPPEWCPGCEIQGVGEATKLAPVSPAADASKPFVVKIHADWCMICLMLDVTWAELQQKLGSQARLVLLDVTNEETGTAARAEAERLGILPFFERYRFRTGTVGVLHGASRESVAILLGELDIGTYEAALKEATRADGS